MLAWRYAESLPICEQALALARAVGAREAEVRALTVLGGDLAYLGRGEEGLAHLRRPCSSPRRTAITRPGAGVRQLHRCADDAGRPRESARLGQAGLEVLRRYGIDSTVLVSNRIEALLAIGEWDEADSLSAAALRAITANYPYMLLMHPRRPRDRPRRLRRRAGAPRGRARHAARGPRAGPLRRLPRRAGAVGAPLDGRRQAVRDGLARARSRRGRPDPRLALRQGTARTGGAGALARARRDADAVRTGSVARGSSSPSLAAPAAEASAVTPNAAGWLALAEAEYERARGAARPESWSEAAAAWERLERPPLAAYCRWRQAEALVAAGASRTEASVPLREAHAVAARIGAKPCSASSSCSPNARGSISRRRTRRRPTASRAWRRSSA